MKTIIKVLLITCLILSLSSCFSRINKANYDQIQPGMSYADVVRILGEPTSSSTLTFGDITGLTANWENRNGKIKVQFFNGFVKLKQFYEGVSTPRET